MNRADIYLELFGQLEQQLKNRAGITDDYVDFYSVIKILVDDKRDRVVEASERQLKSYAALRNVIAHKYSKEPIADPRQDTIDSLTKLIDGLMNPQLAQDIMVHNPTSFNISESVKYSILTMATRGFTSVPVYDEDGIVGVLSERSAVKWVSDMLGDEEVLLKQVATLNDVKSYLDPIIGGDDIYIFATRKQDAFTIRNLFSDTMKNGKRLAAVFITENGKQNEKMIGIITAWDLYKISG